MAILASSSIPSTVVNQSKMEVKVTPSKAEKDSGFAWAHAEMNAILEIQLLPVLLMLLCQVAIRALNDDYVFGIAVGWGMYLPPMYIFSYIIGKFTNYWTCYFTVSLCLAVMALTMYASTCIMINDLSHLLKYLILLQNNANPIAIWTPWTIIFFCNIVMILFCAAFTVTSLVDLQRYRRTRFDPSSNSRIVVFVPQPRTMNAEQIV